MNELIKVKFDDERITISARELHEFLEVKTEYKDWFPRMCEYGFEIGTDYFKKEYTRERNEGGRIVKRNLIDSDITIEMAKDICRKQRRNKKAAQMLEYLLNIDAKEVFIVEPSRKEIEFGQMLDKVTGFNFIRQYPIAKGKYRIDFMLPNEGLMVEYDEKHHIYQKEHDEKRIHECREWLKDNVYFSDWDCPLIRVKEGEELEGLKKIIEFLVSYEYLTCWNEKCVRSI